MGIASKVIIPFLLLLLLLSPQAADSRPLVRRSSPVESSVQAPAPAEGPRFQSPPSAHVVNVTSKDRLIARSGKLFFAMLPKGNQKPPSGPSPGINGEND